MACASVADLLKAKVEDLSETLYLRGSYRSSILGLVPRGQYPEGAGYVRSAFTIGRSEPESDEETWNNIQPLTDNANGACNLTYNSVTTGHKQSDYKPHNFALVGPLQCQDDFAMYWKSRDFWAKYYMALEKRSVRSVENRLLNVYMQYVPKASCNSNFNYIAGDFATQNPVPASPVMTSLGAGNVPTGTLLQQYLDATATELIEEGAAEENTNGWITLGADGPQFPLLIGTDASHQLLTENAELRSDFNQSFQGWGDANPVIQRLGASRIIKNFRHVVYPFPPRWNVSGGVLSRVPTWIMSANSTDATKGKVAITNPAWRSATFEGAVVLNPWVMTEEILTPVNSMPGMKLNHQNYMGDWDYITGNDAVLGFPEACTGLTDPKKKLGRHFAEYRAAWKPIFPLYGRLLLFKRCPGSFDVSLCS